MNIEKILIVADDSAASVKAVRYGFDLARDAGAKVLLLSVIEPMSAIGNPDAGIFPDDALMALKDRTDTFLRQMETAYAGSVETELRRELGDIQPTIIKTITDWGASLVIAGTHGRSGLNKLFTGRVAESIIQHSPVPVCIVPRDQQVNTRLF